MRGLSREFGTVYVPLQEDFNQAAVRVDASYWLWDGVHPTAAGHHLIAEEWLKVVGESDLNLFFWEECPVTEAGAG